MQRYELLWSAASLAQACAVCLHGPFLFKPRKGFTQDFRCTVVGRHDDAIVHPLAIAPRGYYAGAPQIGEVPGDFGLRLIQNLNEVADAELLISHEVQKAKPRIVAERLEELAEVESLFLPYRHGLIIYALTDVSRKKYILFGEYIGDYFHGRAGSRNGTVKVCGTFMVGQVVMLDVRDRFNPKQISVVSFGANAGPHNIVLSDDDSRLVVTDYFLNEDAAGIIHFEGDHKVHVLKVTHDTLTEDTRFKLDFNTAFKTGPARDLTALQ